MSSDNPKGKVIVIVGGQFGDEGKGKITSYLAETYNIEAIARAGTGPNAGHTVVHQGQTYKLRLIPSGFFSEQSRIYIGAGVLVNEQVLLQEIETTGVKDRFFIDRHTGVITPEHIDTEKENNHLMGKIGSTGSGCGIANIDRIKRILRLAKDYESLKPYIADVSEELNDIIDAGGTVLVEGSQATFLSLYHGTYPYVTSKDVTASAALSDLGIGPTKATEVIVVFKSYVTRVGTGHLEGELSEEEVVKRGWQEYGTVTGRLRRAAPFNHELARKAVRINGATAIALTKLDILFPVLKGATTIEAYEAVPEAMKFVQEIEDSTKIPVKYLSTGPEAEALIVLS
ncbi:MAG: adenylosuccinate synthetase [Candidatus Heimdallarchaeota archaeon]|nr:adenylosuccinate synthetase [Candidatus Heimdallarchaeota archaeon]